MKGVIIGIALLLAQQGYAMRCGGSLVLEGDSKPKILEVCGTPQFELEGKWGYKIGNVIYTVHFDNLGTVSNITEIYN